MKRILVVTIVMALFSMPFGVASLYITEVMHSPTQVSDSEGEWLEIYNDGSTAVNLASWTIDEKTIGNTTINSQEYLVLARELLDTSDTDTESFESYWGNNNGIWDENFQAIELSLSLKDEDTIILTDGTNIEELAYNTSFGGTEGKTIERLSLTEWQEGPVDGTPGFGNFSASTTNMENEIYLFLDILNNLPEILSLNMTDDEENEGIQILPLLSGEKPVFLEVLINDTDGDIQNVVFTFADATQNMTKKENISATAAWYEGNFTLSLKDLAGEYNISVTVSDSENTTSLLQLFTYEGIVATELNVSSFDMKMYSGGIETRLLQLINQGNVEVDAEVSAEDLVSKDQVISKNTLAIFDNVWLSLENPVFLDANIQPQTSKDLQLRIQLPPQVRSGHYEGKITITSLEST